MWQSGFFNSVSGDRTYNAESFNDFLTGLVTNGIFQSVGNKLAVKPNSGMTVQVDTGKGFFGGHWVKNTAPLQLTLEEADVTLNRYAGIFIRVDETLSGRKAEPYVKYSDIASNPLKPTVTRSDNVNDYCLAYVYIKAGAKAITASDIIDTRQDSYLCGWVTGLIQQLDIKTIYSQFESMSADWMDNQQEAFTDWIQGIKDTIDSNVETMLVSAVTKSETITISTANWNQTTEGYTATFAIAGMTDTKTVIIVPDNDSASEYMDCGVVANNQTNGNIGFRADKVPTKDLKVNICFMGK